MHTYRCTLVTVYGTEYKIGCWLCIGVKQYETCLLPLFGVLHHIVLVGCEEQCPEIIMIVERASTLGFFHKAFGYVVQLQNPKSLDCISIGNLKYYHPLNAYLTSEGQIVKCKEDLYAFFEQSE